MTQYVVRHAVLQYNSKNSADQDTYETAFRGMTVELPEGPATERLLSLGAVVPEGEQLVRPGTMRDLPETATDAEIMSWVVGATMGETEQLVLARPAMADRLLAAQESVKERFAEQAEHLSGVAKAARENPSTTELLNLSTDMGDGLTPAPQASSTPTPAVNSPGDAFDSPAPGGALIEDSGQLSAEEADKIVGGQVKAVAEYVSENPTHAKAILAAESRRSEDTRPGVVRAVQAAASFGVSGK